jgi:hypothetical protein
MATSRCGIGTLAVVGARTRAGVQNSPNDYTLAASSERLLRAPVQLLTPWANAVAAILQR